MSLRQQKKPRKKVENPKKTIPFFKRKTTTPETTTPETTTLESTTPESTTPESTTLESTTLESTTLESTTLESTTPESTTPETTTPETTTTKTTTTKTTTTKTTTTKTTTTTTLKKAPKKTPTATQTTITLIQQPWERVEFKYQTCLRNSTAFETKCPGVCDFLEKNQAIQGWNSQEITLLGCLGLEFLIFLGLLGFFASMLRNDKKKQGSAEQFSPIPRMEPDIEITKDPTFNKIDPAVIAKHSALIKARREEEAQDTKSTKFRQKGSIFIPRAVDDYALTQRISRKNIKLTKVSYNEANNENYDIGSDMDDVELDPSTVQTLDSTYTNKISEDIKTK